MNLQGSPPEEHDLFRKATVWSGGDPITIHLLMTLIMIGSQGH